MTEPTKPRRRSYAFKVVAVSTHETDNYSGLLGLKGTQFANANSEANAMCAVIRRLDADGLVVESIQPSRMYDHQNRGQS